MLVLDRLRSQAIIIDANGIKIRLVNCGSAKMHIGIEAPRHVTILREELYNDNNGVPRPPTRAEAARKRYEDEQGN